MNLLLIRFFDICLFRTGPQDLPDSLFLLTLTVLAFLITGLFAAITDISLIQALVMAVLNQILLALFAYLLLWINNLGNRYIQTLTALSGTSALIGLCSLPLLLWAQLASQGKAPGLLLSSSLIWASLFWQIGIYGHIFRHAISTLLPIGMALSVLYTLISFNINRMLLGNLN